MSELIDINQCLNFEFDLFLQSPSIDNKNQKWTGTEN